jgi:hypothetical protein
VLHNLGSHPDQEAFAAAIAEGKILVQEPTGSGDPRFSPAEREVLALAQLFSAAALIDDPKPYREARRLELEVINVPEFLVSLFDGGRINSDQVTKAVVALQGRTNRKVLDWAIQQLCQRGVDLRWLNL